MNREHHIQELEKRIDHIKNEPTKGWLGKISKSIKVRRIEKKIRELKKSTQSKTENEEEKETQDGTKSNARGSKEAGFL